MVGLLVSACTALNTSFSTLQVPNFAVLLLSQTAAADAMSSLKLLLFAQIWLFYPHILFSPRFFGRSSPDTSTETVCFELIKWKCTGRTLNVILRPHPVTDTSNETDFRNLADLSHMRKISSKNSGNWRLFWIALCDKLFLKVLLIQEVTGTHSLLEGYLSKVALTV